MKKLRARPKPPHNPIGVLVALPDEAQSLRRFKPGCGRLVRTGDGHHLIASGAGPDHARRAALRLVQQGVSGLMSWGCAGALVPGLQPGHLVIPQTLLGADGERFAPDPAWHERFAWALDKKLSTSTDLLAESAHVVATVAAKQALRAATQATAVDMESAALARVAREHGLPFLVVRAIADHWTLDMPKAVTFALNRRGEVRLLWLLAYTLAHPGQVPQLVALGRAFESALQALRAAKAHSGADFCFPTPNPDF